MSVNGSGTSDAVAKPRGQLKIAILGGGPSLADAPLHDTSYVFWSMPWIDIPEMDLYFEPHSDWRELGEFYPCGMQPGAVAEFLAATTSAQSPIMMLQKEPDLPHSIAFPFAAADALSGGRYLESTVAYMLAFAALATQPGDEVAMWGCDLDVGSEYVHQRPNAEFWCGILAGRGVSVTTSPQSSILRSVWSKGYYGAPGNKFIGDGMSFAAKEQVQEYIERTGGKL